jgi:hypothetical protein
MHTLAFYLQVIVNFLILLVLLATIYGYGKTKLQQRQLKQQTGGPVNQADLNRAKMQAGIVSKKRRRG